MLFDVDSCWRAADTRLGTVIPPLGSRFPPNPRGHGESYTDCSLCSRGRLSVAPQNRLRLWNADLVANTGKRMPVRWKIGERVTTPNGFVAEIIGLEDDKAFIRYLSTPPGTGETDLPLELLRPATARDLLLARIKT